MELVEYSECYSPCLHPLCMRVTCASRVVTMRIQVHQTLKTLELRRKHKVPGGGCGWNRVPVPYGLFRPPPRPPPLASCHCAVPGMA